MFWYAVTTNEHNIAQFQAKCARIANFREKTA